MLGFEQNDGEGHGGARLDYLQGLHDVVLEDPRDRVEKILDVAREVLGMEFAYVSRMSPTHQEVLEMSDRSGLVDFKPGTTIPIEGTYCGRMLAGEIPNVIPDTSKELEVADLTVTHELRLRAYVGVPVELSDGRIFGTLCCLNGQPRPDLEQRDSIFMRVLARLLADELERKEIPDVPGDETVERDAATAKLSLWFAGAPRAAPAARQALQSLSEELESTTLSTMNLLVTELVTNSVRHAGIDAASAVGLDVIVGPRRVRATVSDPGPGFVPNSEMPDDMAEGGRGMPLVDSLSQSWGVECEDGTRVWFELELKAGAPAPDPLAAIASAGAADEL